MESFLNRSFGLLKFQKISSWPYLDWFLFLPLLLLYWAIIILRSKDTFVGDELRYLGFAKNLLNGYYATPDFADEFLWNGPGYPIFLAALIFIKAPLILIKFCNSLFLFFGVVLLFRTLKTKIPFKYAFILSYCAGLTHPYIFISLTIIHTEALSFFLVSCSLHFFIKYHQNESKKDLILFSFFSGYLILTKVFFAYVFLALGLLSILFSTLKKFNLHCKKLIKISFFPFVICLPYLFYTYNLTGDLFYWSNAGGSSLYSMSTPYESEYGDWFPISESLGDPPGNSFSTNFKSNSLKENHLSFILSLQHLNGYEKDKRLKEKAIKNIINNKTKYLKNIIYNFGRISFRFPFTNREVSPLLLIILVIHFSILLFPLLGSIYKILKDRNDEFGLVLNFFSIFLLGTLLLSAESRFIFPIYPLLIFLISYLFINDTKTLNNNSGI